MLTYKKTSIIPQGIHILTRRIPGTGQILVKVGARVKPYEIVGVGEKSVGFRSLDLAKLLNVKPASVGHFLLKNLGAFIYKGEVLARKKEWWGLRQIEIFSPLTGVFRDLNEEEGLARLEYLPEKVKIPAGVAGKVFEIGENVVRIEAVATEVRGVAGIGHLKEGTLNVLGDFNLPILAEKIQARDAGKIIAGGSLMTKEVLYKCLAVGVKGVISGGINFIDYQELMGPRSPSEEVGVGLLILEGFGNLPVSKKVTQLLQSLHDQQVQLYGAQKKLIIPKLEEKIEKGRVDAKRFIENQKVGGFAILKNGQNVRILATSYLGQCGKIKKLQRELQELPSGIKSQTVRVELEDGREIEVGVSSVEIYET